MLFKNPPLLERGLATQCLWVLSGCWHLPVQRCLEGAGRDEEMRCTPSSTSKGGLPKNKSQKRGLDTQWGRHARWWWWDGAGSARPGGSWEWPGASSSLLAPSVKWVHAGECSAGFGGLGMGWGCGALLLVSHARERVMPATGAVVGVSAQVCAPPAHIPLPCRVPFAMTGRSPVPSLCHGGTTASKKRGESHFHSALTGRPGALSSTQGRAWMDPAGLRAPPGWL